MNIELQLAWRNLWRHSKRTWITVAAMVFSNTLLVFMLSLQLGSYRMMIDNSLSLLSGQLQLQHPQYLDSPKLRFDLKDPHRLAETLRAGLSTDAIAIRAASFSLVSSEVRSFGVQVLGVEPRFDRYTSTLPGLITQGRYLEDPGPDSAAKSASDPEAGSEPGSDSESESGSEPECIIGSLLARNLRVGVGDELTLLGSGRDGSFAAAIVRIRGIFTSHIPELDRNLLQLPLADFQRLYGTQGHANYLVINTPDAMHLSQWKIRIKTLIAKDWPGLVLRDWDELQPGIRQAIAADLSSAAFMYGVLILLVAFSVMNTQLMSVLERTREFGTVMALGLKPARLVRLILLETGLMALLGLILGVLLGCLLTLYFHYQGFSYPGMEEMSLKFNLPARFYPDISLISALAGPVLVLLGFLLAALYPALKLRKLEPITAMRSV